MHKKRDEAGSLSSGGQRSNDKTKKHGLPVGSSKRSIKNSISKLEEDLSVAVAEGNEKKAQAIKKTIVGLKAIEKKSKA